MNKKWVDEFCNKAESKGINCRIIRRINGWIETLLIEDKLCYTKSITYSVSRNQYFQGIDPKKFQETGDIVLLCGGVNGEFRDIFIIPWSSFFKTIKAGEPINTYRPPREYYQYKFYVRDRDDRWILSVQGGQKPNLNISKWRYNLVDALEYFK